MTIKLNLNPSAINFYNTQNIWISKNKVHLKLNLEELMRINYKSKHFVDTKRVKK